MNPSWGYSEWRAAMSGTRLVLPPQATTMPKTLEQRACKLTGRDRQRADQPALCAVNTEDIKQRVADASWSARVAGAPVHCAIDDRWAINNRPPRCEAPKDGTRCCVEREHLIASARYGCAIENAVGHGQGALIRSALRIRCLPDDAPV